MTDKKWIKWGAITITVAGALWGLYLFFDVLIGILAPFLIAFLLAAATHPAAKRFASRTHLSPRVTAVVFTLLALGAAGGLLYILFSRALLELQNLVHQLSVEGSVLGVKFSRMLECLSTLISRMPKELSGGFAWLDGYVEDPQAFFDEQLRGMIAKLSERIPALIMRVLGALPSVVLFLLVTLIACFYFSAEYDAVIKSIKGILPPKWQEKMPQTCQRMREGVGQYLRAYGLLFLITFAELLLGFAALRVNFVFLMALLVAFLDFLPIFGVGTVLLPWSVFSLVMGDTALGIGLLVLYAVITVLRQVIEPHIVGKSLGLHPILMLVALYAGLRIFGIIGVFAGPAAALILKALLLRGRTENT